MNIQINLRIQNGELSLTPSYEMTANEREEYEKLAAELIGKDRIIASVIYNHQTLRAASPFYPRESIEQKAKQSENVISLVAKAIRNKIECECQ